MIWQVGLYAAAVLIPLAAFAVEAIFIRQLKRSTPTWPPARSASPACSP